MSRRILFTGLRLPRLDTAPPPSIELLHTPTIRVAFRTPRDGGRARAMLGRAPRIVFPSRSAVEGFARWLEADRQDAPSGLARSGLARSEAWAIGEATARAVRERLALEPRLPARASAAGLVEALRGLDPAPVLLPVGDRHRPELPQWLRESGTEHLVLQVYRTGILRSPEVRRRHRNDPADWVVFLSPSTVRGFLLSLGLEDLGSVVSRLASIGPTTSRAVRSAGGRVRREGARPDPAALVSDLVRLPGRYPEGS